MSGWSTACLDWESRILSGRSLVPELPLFEDEAERALRIFKRLKLPDVFNTPRMEEASGEWFFKIVEALFGAYNPETNRRMIQEIFLLVPKKNGKSSYAAAIMVVACIMNRRPEAEFLLIAPTKKIADIAFKQASGIIRLDPELNKLFLTQRHIRTITHRQTGATILIQAADTDVITGSKSTGILVDETHVFAKMSRAADVFVEIRGALTARPDGFMLQISTQSKEPPSGIFKSELYTARDVRDGKIVLPLLPVLYELPASVAADGGWKNRRFWPLINPNIGKSVDDIFLSNELLKAEGPQGDAAKLALLASQHFNVEIGLGLRTDRWVGADFWTQNAAPLLTLDDILTLCDVAVVGIDGGGLDDLLGLAVLGRQKVTRRWMLWNRAWAHKIVLERRKEIAAKLADLVKEGTLKLIDNDSNEDVIEVADIVQRVADAGLLPDKAGVGADAVGVVDVVDELERRGFSAAEDVQCVVAVKQGWPLVKAIKTLERRLSAGEVCHPGSELMTWCVGNAKAVPKGNNILIEKATAGSAKIDPLIATFNAVDLMSMNPEGRGASARAWVL